MTFTISRENISSYSLFNSLLARGVNPFFGLEGGGGGGKSKENLIVLQCLTVLFNPILALHYEYFKLSKLLGGGGQNDMCAPQYFHWGG